MRPPHDRPRAVRRPGETPPLSRFLKRERQILDRCTTPTQVQVWLNQLPYNREPGGETQRSFRQVVARREAHCLEAALAAAVILEQHGYPPRVLSFESEDGLDHVIYVYQAADDRWGSIARSRDPGLHGRRPVFRTPRDLALSYFEPYIDETGRITAYQVVDLRDLMGAYDWRFSNRNLWKVEQALIDYPHRPIASSDRRVARLRARYRAFRERFPGRKPLSFYPRRDRWTPFPRAALIAQPPPGA